MVDINPEEVRAAATKIDNVAQDQMASLTRQVSSMRQEIAEPMAFDDRIAGEAKATMAAFETALKAGESNNEIIADWLERTPKLLTDYVDTMVTTDGKHERSARDINVEPPR